MSNTSVSTSLKDLYIPEQESWNPTPHIRMVENPFVLKGILGNQGFDPKYLPFTIQQLWQSSKLNQEWREIPFATLQDQEKEQRP